MKATALLAAFLCLAALAADDAVVAPQPIANRQSPVANRADAIAIPQMMTYQGRLTDATGTPVADGLYAIRFRLYAQPTGGTHFWEENQQVRTRDGLFSVLLGAVTPIRIGARGQGLGVSEPETGDGRPGTGDEGRGARDEGAYLGMAVEGSEEMVPRLRLANGYAIPNDRAGANDDKGGGTDDDDEWVHSDSVLFTVRRLGIAKGGSSNNMYGSGATRSTHVNLGVASTTGENGYQREYAVILGGYQNTASRGYATVAGGTENVANGPSATVVGGYRNTASGWRSTICGGYSNVTAGVHSAVPGGWANRAADSSGFAAGTHAKATHKYSAVIGLRQADSTFSIGPNSFTVGAESTFIRGRTRMTSPYRGAFVADSGLATIGYVNTHVGDNDSDWVRVGSDSVLYTAHKLGIARGGAGNMLRGVLRYTHVNLGVACTTGTSGGSYAYATVGGGVYNTASGDGATVAGGQSDTASGVSAAVGGGGCDSARALYGGALSGYANRGGDAVDDTAACVAGGYANLATGQFAFVGGGRTNIATATYATVGGGYYNAAAGNATVGGGTQNTASGNAATVAGGFGVIASGYVATVGGGFTNTASGDAATVAGGNFNIASGVSATACGGYMNTATGYAATVSGGYNNYASGIHSTIPGGSGNTAPGGVSLAAGRYARANHRGSFVWSDSSVAASESVYTTGTDQFRVRARGGTWFFSNAGMSKAVYLASGGNTWTSVGWDRDGDARPVNRKALLDKLAALPVVEYGSKADGGGPSIGPSGRDFHAAFGYGTADGISTGDADGVLLAAVQALYEQNQTLSKRVAELEAKQK